MPKGRKPSAKRRKPQARTVRARREARTQGRSHRLTGPESRQQTERVERVREFIVGSFNFLRNLLIVGLLTYFGDKTDSWFLKLLAVGSLAMLAGYYILLLHTRQLKLFDRVIPHKPLANAANAFFWGVLIFLTWEAARRIVGGLVKEIARAHAA